MKRSFKKKYEDFLFDHEVVKHSVDYIKMFFMALLSAAIFAFGFRCFTDSFEGSSRIISGGISGASQVAVKILELCHVESISATTLQSLFYFLLNIPILFIAFRAIGKKFAFFTIINVVATSLFISWIPDSLIRLFYFINPENPADMTYMLARSLFAGFCTGISSVVAFKGSSSAGGIDVIALWLANKKSISVGKYIVIFNGLLILTYSLLNYFGSHNDDTIHIMLYSIIYLFVTALVNDMLNIRNKKAQVQIITTNENMGHILIANFPHSCTICDAKGAFTDAPKKIIYMSISTREIKHVTELVRMIDPNAFVNVVSLQQVYGKFYITPYE